MTYFLSQLLNELENMTTTNWFYKPQTKSNILKELNNMINNTKKYYDEGNDDYNLELPLPGYSKEEVSVSIEKACNYSSNLKSYYADQLLIKASNEKYGECNYKYNLYNVDLSKVTSEMKNGILKITLPLNKEKVKEQSIKVEVK